MLTGGYNGGKALNSSMVFPTNCDVPNMTTGLTEHVTFLTQDVPSHVASCGGFRDNVETKKCAVLKNGAWSNDLLDDLPDYRSLSASVRLNAGVFILGGAQTTTTSLFLPAGTRTWVSGPKLREEMNVGLCAAPISSHSFLIVNNKDVREFDIWEAGVTSPAGWKPQGRWPRLQVWRRSSGCAVLKTKFFVAGGYDMEGYTLKSTEIIDIEQRTIHFASELQNPRFDFHLLVISANLYALGGRHFDMSNGFDYVADVEEFIQETETWEPTNKNLSAGRYEFGGVVIDRDLVCGQEEAELP